MTTTIVGGRVLVADRRLTVLDADAIMDRMGRLAQEIDARN